MRIRVSLPFDAEFNIPVEFNITCCINLGMDGCELESVYRLMLSLIFNNGEDYIELFVSVTGQM